MFPSTNEEIAYLGKEATITCKAEGYPEPTYTLYHNTTQLTQNVNGGLYTITDIKLDDAGEYKCVAENTLGDVTESCNLTLVSLNLFQFNPNA